MSIVIVRKALEKRLAALDPAIATAWENIAFTPVTGTPYQRADMLMNSPDNSVMGSAVYWERGFFHVTLCYPHGSGSAAAASRAQLTRDHFMRSTTMAESGINVIVSNTPRIAAAITDGDRYCISVSIPFQAQINT